MRSSTKRLSPRATLAGCATLLLLLSTAPLTAQEKMGGKAFRTSLGASLLMPMDGYGLEWDQERLPSGRAVLEIQANPVFGFTLGGIRLAPNVMWPEDEPNSVSAFPRQQVAINAGLLGFRLNFMTGRVRFGPFAEAAGGIVQLRRDEGGVFYTDGSGPGYAPRMSEPLDGFVAGGGGGAQADLILGPGLTLNAIAGYWHFLSVADEDPNAPLLTDPISGLFAGAGVKLSFRNETYYWRHSGRDDVPPVIAILDPEPEEAGVVNVGRSAATLTIQAHDRSGVDSLFVAGQRVRLTPAGRVSDAPAVMASVPVTLHPGPNEVRFRAYDGAGNVVAGIWEVHGVPLDKDPPVITVLQPEDDLTVGSDRVQVEAIIHDRSPIRQVTLNGLTITAVEGTAEDRAKVGAEDTDFVVRFQSTTSVSGANSQILIAAVDSASNAQLKTLTVHRAGAAQVAQAQRPGGQTAGPEIDIHAPTEWTGAGTRGFAAQPKASIRLAGMARYGDGIREVRANGQRLSLQRDPNNPGLVQFSGFIPPPEAGSSGQVELIAIGMDGRQSVRTFEARTAEAPAVAAPARFENVANAQNRQRWAVVVGVNTYLDRTIGDLRYADADARAVYDFLRSPAAGMGGIPEDNIRLLLNEDATARNIRSALTTFLRNSTPDDVIFIYIAAHGAPDPYRLNDLYILAHDTEIEDIAATGVSMDVINDAIRSAYAYNKILITDACHSAGVGAGGTRSVNANLVNAAFLEYMDNSTGGFVAFTASEANQLSQEGPQYGGGHGVFTYYLLRGLQGEADDDGDGVVTLGELMEFTRDRVRRSTRNAQIPTISLTTYDRFWPMAAVLEAPGGADDES